MARQAVVPAEEKTRIVLSVLAGEVTVAEAARRASVSEQSVGNGDASSWKQARPAWPLAGRSGPSTRKQQLEAEVADLTQTLGEVAVGLRMWTKNAGGRLGPSRTSSGAEAERSERSR